MKVNRFIELQGKFHECCFISIPKMKKRVIWELTHYCPMGCPYCFTSSTQELSMNREFLQNNSFEIIKRLISLNVEDVLLTGGEPLYLKESLLTIAKFLNEKDISFTISTTGNPIEYLEKVINFNPRRVNLSFDAANKNISWKSDKNYLENSLKVLAKRQIPVKLTSVVTKKNFSHLDAYFTNLDDILSRYDIIEKIAITTEFPIGRALLEEGLCISEIQMAKDTIRSRLNELGVDVVFVNWPSLNSPLQHCPAGKSIFSIMPDGTIAPCSLLYYLSKSFGIGNVLRDSTTDVEKQLSLFYEGVERHVKEIKTWNPTCKKCNKKQNCGGGCFASMPVLMMDHKERIICEFQPKIIADEQKHFFANIERPLRDDYPIPESSGRNEPIPIDMEKEIGAFIRKRVTRADLTHNFEHIENVVRLGKCIALKEKANEKIVTIACYFHDASPRNSSMHHFHTLNSAKVAEDYLKTNTDLKDYELLHVRECIITSSYGSYLLGTNPKTIEAKIVRDADFLDAMGARGIARVFAFAASNGLKDFGKVDYLPEKLPIIFEMNLTGPDKSPIHHFYTKLLKLYPLLLTDTGKELGIDKHNYMISFLKQYSKEVEISTKKGLQASLDGYQ